MKKTGYAKPLQEPLNAIEDIRALSDFKIKYRLAIINNRL